MKKNILMLSLVSALLVSGFYIIGASASDCENPERQFKNRGEFSEERIVGMKERFSNMNQEWENLTLEEWKSKQIERINNITEEEFEKMKKGKGLMMGKREMAE